MRIVRIEVWSFRGLEHALLDDLAPDLNLVVGPNEAGKTTLFVALKYALFERHKGESEDKRALKTWGGSESPRVQIVFEARGARWTLTKQFLKGAYARLEGGGHVFTDDDAEAKLREIWGTPPPEKRKGAVGPLGIWPLLWVEQGRAGVAPHEDLNDFARGKLRDALAGQVCEVAAGEIGQRIMCRIEAERAKWWTKEGKENKELRQLRERLENARAQRAEAKQKLDDAHATADALDGARRALREIEPRLAAQRAVYEGAERALEAANKRAAAIDMQRAERDLRREEKLRAERDLAARDALQTERAESERAVAEARAQLEALRARRDACKEREAAAREELARAKALEAAATELRARASRQAARVEARDRLARARETLRIARELQGVGAALEAALRDVRVDAKSIKLLRAAQSRRDSARAALDAASVHLRMRALRDLVVDGQVVRAGEELTWKCDDERTIEVDATLRFAVSPGGAELARLRDEAVAAERELGAALAEAGVASLPEAEDAFEHRTRIEAQRGERAAAMARLAPKGIGALEENARAIDEELARLGPDDAEAPSIAEAEARLGAARDAVAEAQSMRDVVAEESRALLEEHARSEQALSYAEERARVTAQRLATAPDREGLTRAAEAASRAWSEAEDRLAALEQEHRRSGGLAARDDVEREKKALDRLASERSRLHDESIALHVKLSVEGALGTIDALQLAEEEEERATRELARAERAANAIRALSDAMREARRETERRLVAPVLERIGPYLEGLFRGSQLSLDAEWNVRGLQTGNLEEPIDALSGGAREQLGVLVRLGLAEVLAQEESLPIVLDDSLAYTDAERHAEMLRVLFRASKHQQIIVLSCHPVPFERLGETRRYELKPIRPR